MPAATLGAGDPAQNLVNVLATAGPRHFSALLTCHRTAHLVAPCISGLCDQHTLWGILMMEYFQFGRWNANPARRRELDQDGETGLGRVDTTVPAGGIEEWTLRNTSPMDHPVRLHVWAMQIIEQAGRPVDPPMWQDVVNVLARSNVRVRIAFDDFHRQDRLPLPHSGSRRRRHDGSNRSPVTGCPAATVGRAGTSG
ncbi:multicopper oxidase [Arthrobacter sp. Hiyo4]|nr:multicopper oxidase [Arthrobacter sp. Hiyo4]